MYRNIRLGIAVIFVLSVVFLAHQQAARAGRLPGLSFSGAEGPGQAVEAAKNDKGTVKPPHGSIIIPVTGEYSVGGFCALSVELQATDIQLDALLIQPLPAELPQGVHKVRQGCLLTYSRSGEQLAALPAEAGSTTICFAAISPNQQMTVYFHNTYAPDPVWVPLETTVEAGIACAPASGSGTYVATFSQP